MKAKELLFFVLFLVSQIFYGQEIKNKTNFGRSYSHHMSGFKQRNANYSACDTITSLDCRYIPTGLAWDGENFWVVDTGYIYKVSPAGSFLDSIPNPATVVTFLQGGDLVYDGIYLWYADEQSSVLFKINPVTKSVVQQFNLPEHYSSDPNGFSIAWDGDHLWHCTYDPPMLYKLSPGNLTILDSVQMDKSVLTIEWVKGTLYGLGDLFYKINANTGMAEDSINWCVPFPLGITWDGSAFWNVSGPSEIFGFPTGGLKKIFKMNADVNLTIDRNSNKHDISLFPNPASESTIIKGDRITQVEIYDVTGSLIYRRTGIKQTASVEIPLSTFPKGIYLTRIYNEAGTSTKKLIVQ